MKKSAQDKWWARQQKKVASKRREAKVILRRKLRGTLIWCSAALVDGALLNREPGVAYKVPVQGTYIRAIHGEIGQ